MSSLPFCRARRGIFDQIIVACDVEFRLLQKILPCYDYGKPHQDGAIGSEAKPAQKGIQNNNNNNNSNIEDKSLYVRLG